MEDTNKPPVTEKDRSDIIAKIEKLRKVAGRSPEEQAAFMDKVQELLATYNLTMSDVDREGDTGRRADVKLKGGFYEWERDLWRKVAELHFCWAMRWWEWVPVKRYETRWSSAEQRYIKAPYMDTRKVYQMRVIGRQVNIAAVKAMMSYLLPTFNRLTMERVGGERPDQWLLGKWGVDFRSGMASNIIQRIEDKRQQMLSDERDRERAKEKLQREGVSKETALTLATYSKSEADANTDFVMGEGWTAAQAAKRAREAMIRRMSDAEYTAWAAENPEEAAERERQRAEQARAASRSRYRGGSSKSGRERDWHAFDAGFEAGAKIGLDPQTGQRKADGVLG